MVGPHQPCEKNASARVAEVQSTPTIADRVAALPKAFADLENSTNLLMELEAAMRSDPAAARPHILERYRREKDPAYKGALAVLLGVDCSTHSMLIEDFNSWSHEDADVFRGMALFAVVRKEAAVVPWYELLSIMGSGDKEIRVSRRLRL